MIKGRFSFLALIPGHYTLETTAAGMLVKRAVVISADRTIQMNIVIPIK
jgi:hypothetical protein